MFAARHRIARAMDQGSAGSTHGCLPLAKCSPTTEEPCLCSKVLRFRNTAQDSTPPVLRTTSTAAMVDVKLFKLAIPQDEVDRLQRKLRDSRLPTKDVVPGACIDYGMQTQWALDLYDY